VAAGALCIGIGKGDQLREVGAAHIISDFTNVHLAAAENGGVALCLTAEDRLWFTHA
jgi:hypothetical protein